jgi:ATP-dependent DNA helicase RecG
LAITPDSIRKILNLELKNNCPDTTVIGGLDRMLGLWLAQIKAAPGGEVNYRKISRYYQPETGYAAMSKPQRKAWILKLLGELEGKPEAVAIVPPATKGAAVNEAAPAKRNSPASKKKNVDSTPLNSVALEYPVTVVKGINEALQKKFAKLGVSTLRDLLYYFPARHIDYSVRNKIAALAIGQENTIVANVWESREVMLGKRRSAEATVGDDSGNIKIVWFNQPYMARSMKAGLRVIISGKVSVFRGMPVFESPEWETYEEKDLVHTGRLVPVYPLTAGITQRQVRRIVKPAIDQWSAKLVDFLPDNLCRRLKFLGLSQAIGQAHYPDDERAKSEARRRLAFDELFLLQLGVLRKKRDWQENQTAAVINSGHPVLDKVLQALPYRLTGAQSKALSEVLSDLKGSKPMSRLLQGDVGSGKTVIATLSMLLAVADGYQAAMMAPTEILAEQHWNTLRKTLSAVCTESVNEDYCSLTGLMEKPLNVALLKGDMSAAKKRRIQKSVAEGEIDIMLGTHALIQKDVQFNNLALAVVDEQHRFGVEQRSALRHKGSNPHILVMTATPIPRTLALTLYGDLDISVIDELPPGRQTIKTKWLRPEQRQSAYNFINKEIKAGHQAFIICPLVEESDAIQAKAAVAEYEQLAGEVFPGLRLGLLHGKMSASEKESVMQQFNAGGMDILVSTPVVEVGIDVPNATVMLIESADRFGLSQLHQFRGRVGRGSAQSYCMLMADNPTEIGKKRLDLIENIQNGFVLAEEDLKLRGPGEFFGTRQSGLPDLKMARLTDVSLLEIARHEATRLFQDDPDMLKPEHRLLALELSRVWQENLTTESS